MNDTELIEIFKAAGFDIETPPQSLVDCIRIYAALRNDHPELSELIHERIRDEVKRRKEIPIQQQKEETKKKGKGK